MLWFEARLSGGGVVGDSTWGELSERAPTKWVVLLSESLLLARGNMKKRHLFWWSLEVKFKNYTTYNSSISIVSIFSIAFLQGTQE